MSTDARHVSLSWMARCCLNEEGLRIERMPTPRRIPARREPETRSSARWRLPSRRGPIRPTAAEFASAAAAVVVTKGGTAVCSDQDVREFISTDAKLILGLHRLSARVESYRRQGRRIAFTNGYFDLLHQGHIAYLSHAKERGDILIVAVNSDDSIRDSKDRVGASILSRIAFKCSLH